MKTYNNMKTIYRRTKDGYTVYLPKPTSRIAHLLDDKDYSRGRIIIKTELRILDRKPFGSTLGVTWIWNKNISKKNLKWLVNNKIAFEEKRKVQMLDFLLL